MIILDTHIWIWWVYNDAKLTEKQIEIIKAHEGDGLGISIISCWEIAKLVEKSRLVLHCPIDEWLETALNYPGVKLIELTPSIIVESTQLPGDFHNDPADQMIVATARHFDCSLLTADEKILSYEHVTCF